MTRNIGAFCVNLSELRTRNADLERKLVEQEQKHRAERVDWMRTINNLKRQLDRREAMTGDQR